MTPWCFRSITSKCSTASGANSSVKARRRGIDYNSSYLSGHLSTQGTSSFLKLLFPIADDGYGILRLEEATMPVTASSGLAADIVAFRNYLQAERGLAANTVLAYGRDLERFAQWAAERGLKNYLGPTVRELTHYLAFLKEENLAPPSVARHLIALKMFYRFLRLEERVTQNAVELLSAPALWERIPQVLSPESVEKLLAAPQPQERFYLRDRALLETLYASGSRASEVVGLKLADVFLDAGFCKCHGKGGKQRVVPLGKPAVAALQVYLAKQRPQLVKAAPDA